jgi:hypothetical protein
MVWLLTVCRAEIASVGVDRSEQCVFGGGPSRIQTIFRNRGETPVKLSLKSRLYQASAATLAPVGESKPFRTVTVDANQAVIETVEVDLPATRAEATFLLQWQSDGQKLGSVLIRAFPTNLLDRLASLSAKPVGLFDPDGGLRSAFTSQSIQSLASVDDFSSFDGTLLIVAPSRDKEKRANPESIVLCARRGVGVVWIQPSTANELMNPPSSYVVNAGEGRVVVAQSCSVTNLAQSPTSQVALVRLAELATGHRKLELPKNSQNPEEHL